MSYNNYSGGYDNYGQQQGGYDNYGQQQGGYNQPQGQGGYGGNDFDLSRFTGNETTEELANMMMGGSENRDVINNLGAYEEKARALPDEDFSMDEFYSKYGQMSENADRGIFGFGNSSNFQGESKTSHQLLAAAWAALNWFQNKSRNEGKNVSHGFVKKLLVAFAAAQAVKYWEKSSSSFQSGLPRDLVVEEATRNAIQVANIEYPDTNTGYDYSKVAAQGSQARQFDDSFNNDSGNNYQGNYYNNGQQHQQHQQGYGNNYPQQQYYGGGGY
ncbi:hypothetical protein H4217_007775 [Coemansia sp. RSA 1939]|nr:hypothetical protein H4217_007775 [Coemansia sp. RSA 1939]